MPALELADRVIGITAERRAHQQVRFLEARGATTLHASVLTTVDRTERPNVIATTEQLIASPTDVLVVQTGQGFRWWFNAIGEDRASELIESLRSTAIWCRGPKATSAVRKTGLEVAWQSNEETTRDVVDELSSTDLRGLDVVIQVDGNDPSALVAAADDARSISTLDVYSYRLPTDLAPARLLIGCVIDGQIDAVTFTASPAIRHLRQIAEKSGRGRALDAAFSTGCLACVVGPVCAATAIDAGWQNIIEPPTARLVPMLEELTQALGR